MKLLLPLLTLCSAGILSAMPNPIRNSSFELGRADFGIRRYIRPEHKKVFLEPVFDTAEKIHGRQSIRFDNPSADLIELVSREYQLVPGRTYTFSWYMKSTIPLNIRAGQYIGEMISPTSADWSMLTGRTFRTTAEWKRYSFTFTAKGKRGWYFTLFRWEAEGKNNSATVWLDALQLNEGNVPHPYSPSSEVEAALCGDKRVRFPGVPLPCELRIINHSSQSQAVKATLNLNDTLMSEISFPVQEFSRTVPPHSIITIPISTETKRYGHFRLAGRIEGAGKISSLGDWFFTEIPRPTRKKFNPRKEFITGINCDLGIIFQGLIPNSSRTMNGGGDYEFAQFLKDTGLVLLRLHDGGLQWKIIEPESGKFNWTIADERFHFALKHGFALMPVLGNMFYLRDWGNRKRSHSPLPDWLLKSPDTRIHKMNGSWDGVSPDPNAWERFSAAVASRYKGKIAAYEITNEPNIALPSAGEYVPYLKSAAEIIRRHDPSALIIGGGLTTDYGGKIYKFLEDMGRSGVLSFCDVLSFHPYASPLDSSPHSASQALHELRNLLSRYTQELSLWNTELYYIGPAASSHYAIAGRASHAQHLLRRLCLDLGEGCAASMPIHNGQLLQNELAPHWELGDSFVHSGYIPHDLYTGQSIASYLLNGAKALQRLKWPSGAIGYLYQMNNGQQLAAFWKAPDSQKFSLILPNGDYQLFDMYLNPIEPKSPHPLSEYPNFLIGKNLMKILKTMKLECEHSFRILSAFPVLKNHKRHLLLEVQNISSEKTTAVIRPDFVEQPQIAELEINGKTVVSFPGAENAHPGSTKVYFSDGKRNFMIPLPAFQRKLLRDGEKGSGSFFAFTAISAKKGLHLKISVRDSERGPRNAHAPWEGDSIELFFDSSPLDNPQNIYAGERVKRLFLAPASANGLPEHKSASGMNAAHIRATISGSQDGYRAEVLIPWSELGMQSPGILGFDVKINNVTQKGKLSSEIWSGNKENHRFRHRYGLWYPTQKTTKENMEK